MGVPETATAARAAYLAALHTSARCGGCRGGAPHTETGENLLRCAPTLGAGRPFQITAAA